MALLAINFSGFPAFNPSIQSAEDIASNNPISDKKVKIFVKLIQPLRILNISIMLSSITIAAAIIAFSGVSFA